MLQKNIKTFRGTTYSQERNAASNYSTYADDSSFMSSSTSTILSCSEVEETHNSFQNPKSFVDKFDDNDQVEHVHEEVLPENEYESEGKYFDSYYDFLHKSFPPSY